MFRPNPFLLKDFYKAHHPAQYQPGTKRIYNNWTPRKSRIPGIDKVLFVGLQPFIMDVLEERMNEQFFGVSKDKAIAPYKRRMDTSLSPGAVSVEPLANLWELGYLPLHIKALPEGSLVNMGIPVITTVNTHDDFGWLPGTLETVESLSIWGMITNATQAFNIRLMLERAARKTGIDPSFVKFQAHDFSMRGKDGLDGAYYTGAAHLMSFFGTDTIPAIDFLEYYYGANSETELIGTSVPATEHSVMCMRGPEGEFEVYDMLLEHYQEGILSVVSDTYDLWKIVMEYLPSRKDKIMARRDAPNGVPGKLVIRPDSGNPEYILCGNPNAVPDSPAHRGLINLLYETFPGETTASGYKQLHKCIGSIYGDGITPVTLRNILDRLTNMGYASNTTVYGIGSFTYQYVTRDTFGTAMKATYAEINGKSVDVFKDPVTDEGHAAKKSAKGLLKVTIDGNNDYHLLQGVSRIEENEGALESVWKDGVALKRHTLSEVRARVEDHVKRILSNNG